VVSFVGVLTANNLGVGLALTEIEICQTFDQQLQEWLIFVRVSTSYTFH
jgi:hypothetical protein